MDTTKWKSVLVPVEVYKEIKLGSVRNGRTLSGELREVWKQYKEQYINPVKEQYSTTEKEGQASHFSDSVKIEARKYCHLMLEQLGDDIEQHQDRTRNEEIVHLIDERKMTKAAVAKLMGITKQRVHQVYNSERDQISEKVKNLKKVISSSGLDFDLADFKLEYDYETYTGNRVPLVCWGPGKAIKLFSVSVDNQDHVSRKEAEELKIFETRICFEKDRPLISNFVESILLVKGKIGPETQRFCEQFEIKLLSC